MRLYVGLALLVLAAAATVLGLRQRLWWRVLRRADITTPDELLESARTGRLERRVRAVAGVADADGPPLRSTVNGEPCVWHRHTVRHRQVRYRTDRKGNSHRSSRSKRIADDRSTDRFTLGELGAAIDVLPAEMRVHRPEKRGNRILPGVASKPIPESAELFSGGAVQNSYHHQEWIIRAGTPLFILGEVAGRGGRVAIRRPSSGLHVISTRTGRQLTQQALLLMIAGFAGAVAALTLGLILIFTS